MTETVPADSRMWLRRQRTLAEPRLRLVCFPHAGGAPTFYRGWQDRLPADVELSAVCYPGRQNRVNERPIDRMELLVDHVCQALATLADRPLALFGHGMGAVVAYEVAVRLAGHYRISPAALLVSAHAAPHLCADDARRIPIGDRQLAEQAAAADPMLLRFPELMDLAMIALRADHDLLHAYRPASTPPVTAPITGYLGTDDPRVSHGEMRAWSRVAASGFELRTFPGGHLYPVDAQEALITDIVERLVGASGAGGTDQALHDGSAVSSQHA
ncbi:pyochelin biosynthesis editing thioesterase PchC [Streptosporangium oxazolinicum]|uniref:Pyochelin biosynthesis editing thioesterase PchC n=1 Tax=Streptosporangium oxazolinicum TaxID=909287 RepID=A0ABP8AMY4_9ACTN